MPIDEERPNVESGGVIEQRTTLANREGGHHVQGAVESGIVQQQEIRGIIGRVDGQIAHGQGIRIIEGRAVPNRERLVAAVGEHDVLIERGRFPQRPIRLFPVATGWLTPDVRAVLIGAVRLHDQSIVSKSNESVVYISNAIERLRNQRRISRPAEAVAGRMEPAICAIVNTHCDHRTAA